jgi:hypothetical protein
LLVILAQDAVSIPGYSGWAGAGLLGLVLGWLLLKGLPDQVRQTKELTEAKDKQIDDLIKAKDTAVDKLTAAFRDAQIKAIDTFSALQSSMQENFSQRNRETLAQNTANLQMERETCQRWHEENRERHEENKATLAKILAVQVENRHMMANVLYTAGVKRAAEEGKADGGLLYSENFGDTPPPEKPNNP